MCKYLSACVFFCLYYHQCTECDENAGLTGHYFISFPQGVQTVWMRLWSRCLFCLASIRTERDNKACQGPFTHVSGHLTDNCQPRARLKPFYMGKPSSCHIYLYISYTSYIEYFMMKGSLAFFFLMTNCERATWGLRFGFRVRAGMRCRLEQGMWLYRHLVIEVALRAKGTAAQENKSKLKSTRKYHN